jgi:hypothetical protein
MKTATNKTVPIVYDIICGVGTAAKVVFWTVTLVSALNLAARFAIPYLG